MAEIKELIEKVQSDKTLQEKIQNAADKNAVLKAVTDAGFNISADDVEKVIAAVKGAKVGDAISNIGDKIHKLF